MEDKKFKAGIARLALAMTYIGLFGAVVMLFVIWMTAQTRSIALWLGFFAFLACSGGGTILFSKKCKCPYCGVGGGGNEADRAYMSKIPFFKKEFTCPNCKKQIKL